MDYSKLLYNNFAEGLINTLKTLKARDNFFYLNDFYISVIEFTHFSWWLMLLIVYYIVRLEAMIKNTFHYIDTDEIPGFFLLLKNHIFIARSEDTIFVFDVWRYWCRHGY